MLNNFVLLEPEQLKIRSLKYDKDHTDLIHYTHAEWFDLYEKYFLKNSFPLFNKTDYQFSPLFPVINSMSSSLMNLFINILRDSCNGGQLNNQIRDRKLKVAYESESRQLYQFLFSLSRVMNPTLTIEFGTGDGLTSICLFKNLSNSSSFITIDNKNWESNKETFLSAEDFESDNTLYFAFDFSLSENLEKIFPIISKSELIVLNICDGSISK